VQLGKMNKTEYFLADRKGFMAQLVNEISKIEVMHDAVVGDEQIGRTGKVIRYKKFAIRLNGTSDIPFENIKVFCGLNIFELFPNIQFYDYTKNHTRLENKIIPINYHITFSRSETNDIKSLDILNRGFNVAYVFGVKDVNDLPKSYMGFKVINGDESDLRFLDEDNVIVGLKYKLMTGKGTKGVNKDNVDNNDFLINVEDIPVQDQSYVGMIVNNKVEKLFSN
jgi:hypothetical protein